MVHCKSQGKGNRGRVHERLVKVAKGAAMMTETVFEEEFLGAAYDALSNKVLEKVVQ
jgi:aminobenzoyl-glutamate utilization protein B